MPKLNCALRCAVTAAGADRTAGRSVCDCAAIPGKLNSSSVTVRVAAPSGEPMSFAKDMHVMQAAHPVFVQSVRSTAARASALRPQVARPVLLGRASPSLRQQRGFNAAARRASVARVVRVRASEDNKVTPCSPLLLHCRSLRRSA